MRKPLSHSISWQLARHFFRRFFENDVLQSDGDTSTTVARALAIAAAPGLMFAFFLQNAYPQRTVWGRLEDQYFFVLFSFVTMAGVALFEWEMLFPERLDFLVLTPLPLRPGQLLRAKAAALAALLGFFLLAANVWGVFLLPLVTKGAVWHMMWAQAVAVALAGIFGAVAVMAVGGVLLCVLPSAMFRRLSPLLQTVATASLTLLVIGYARYGDDAALFLQQPGVVARWAPTVWFLGIFERLLHGGAAETFAVAAARRAWVATGLACALAVLTYPVAWVKVQRLAMQGEVMRDRPPSRWWAALQTQVVQQPTQRAVFSFIGKTVVRNSRYQVYLAIYSGVGLALSIACGMPVRHDGSNLHVAVMPFGTRMVTPLLLFWIVAGLRMAFAFPQNLPARWIFRVTGAEPRECARATRRWADACGGIGVVFLAGVLAVLGWGWRALLVQVIWGACFSDVLVESFFATQNSAPFTRPRSPGKQSLPAVLTLYVGILPPLLFGIAWAELQAERRLMELIWPIAAVGLLRIAIQWAQVHLIWTGEEGEGPEGEIQLLGLAGELRS